MILKIIIVVVGVLVLATLGTLGAVCFAQATTDGDPKVRRRAHAVEVVFGLATLSLGAITTQNARERRLVLVAIGTLAAVRLFRVARLLIARGRA